MENKNPKEDTPYIEGYKDGFQKGKLEQKKEELKFLNKLSFKGIRLVNFMVKFNDVIKRVRIRKEQLSKEIWGIK